MTTANRGRSTRFTVINSNNDCNSYLLFCYVLRNYMVFFRCWWRAYSISIVTHKVGGFIEWVAHLRAIRISEVCEVYWVHKDLFCKSFINWHLTLLANMNFLFGAYRLVWTVLLPNFSLLFICFQMYCLLVYCLLMNAVVS